MRGLRALVSSDQSCRRTNDARHRHSTTDRSQVERRCPSKRRDGVSCWRPPGTTRSGAWSPFFALPDLLVLMAAVTWTPALCGRCEIATHGFRIEPELAGDSLLRQALASQPAPESLCAAAPPDHIAGTWVVPR